MEIRTTSGDRGATLLALLIVIAILGIAVSLVAQSWSQRIRREKEAELLFRGLAYKHALESYARATPAGASPRPARVEDLLVDDRLPHRVRHLRQAYVDPMTGDPFLLLLDARGRIRGVAGGDARVPLRQTGFPEELEALALAKTYRDWRFIAVCVGC